MKRTLGKSGIEVSAMGLGCWAIGGAWKSSNDGDTYAAGWGQVDDAESIKAIRAGLDAGINFFDTAANYGAGHSERLLSKAFAGRRDKVVIATKFGFRVDEEKKFVHGDDDKVLENVRSDCEANLRNLGTDYIDILQLHVGELDVKRAMPVRDTLEDLVKEGKIRWYGWSTDLPEQAAAWADGEHFTSIQFDLNVYRDNPEIRATCAEFDLAGINKSPLNRGILTGKFDVNSTFPEDDIRHGIDWTQGIGAQRLQELELVREVLSSGGRTLAQGSLAYIWALDERMVPIPGFKTVRQVEENAQAMEFGPLGADEMRQIDELLGRTVPS